MAAIDFEWDERKAAENFRTHAVTFEMARDVFRDPFAVERLDDREEYGEDRFIVIGMVEGRLPVSRLHSERPGNTHHLGPRGGTP
jgi:uncharacterized DUF497 family protein